MNETESHASAPPSPFWPTFFLSLTLILFLAAQIHGLWNGSRLLKKQEAFFAQQTQKAQGETAQARTTLALLEGLANDLLLLANSDPEIRKIVDKYQIRKENPTPPPGRSAPKTP